MYKGPCLHPQLSRVLADVGHTDMITIVDAGFPVPMKVERVDLGWKADEPRWLDVCELIEKEMCIEKVILAEEIKEKNELQLKQFLDKLDKSVEVVFVGHTEFKKLSHESRAIVRTGECSPFCNVILVAGCNF